MDLEGFVKRKLKEGEKEDAIIAEMGKRIIEIKRNRIRKEDAEALSKAILEEAKRTIDLKDELFTEIKSGVRMGEFGVGSRGLGDFYAHEKIGEIIGATSAVVDSTSLSDSGVVRSSSKGKFVVITVDGMHSRLSDFPFLAGFHVARAALRDVYVMGATPVALFSDIHVADDGDVAKIFDHVAGISAVSVATDVPLVTGSTLRIGGDVVIGERMTGCVGAVGVAEAVVSREGAKEGDVILMTEGAGGGTISTAALYYGESEAVKETLNIKFLKACNALIEEDMVRRIHVMTDVTNGGIRGDANEIAKVAAVKLVFYEQRIRSLVNVPVLRMLERHGIDYLGVSLDALLIICPKAVAEDVKKVVRSTGVRIEMVGRVEVGSGAEIVMDGERKKFIPKFRESAYTPVKKVVGENVSAGNDFEEMKRKVDKAVEEAIYKRDRVKEVLEGKGNR
ncbi:MAG: AIR synthase-related protein [Methanophagales archaeon]|nr:AIR synthase-related protein [Methanophagales archaeon]